MCVCVLWWSLSSIAFHILQGVGVSRENPRLNPLWEVLLYATPSVQGPKTLCSGQESSFGKCSFLTRNELEMRGVCNWSVSPRKAEFRSLGVIKTGWLSTALLYAKTPEAWEGPMGVRVLTSGGAICRSSSVSMVWRHLQQVLSELSPLEEDSSTVCSIAEVLLLLWITLRVYFVL